MTIKGSCFYGVTLGCVDGDPEISLDMHITEWKQFGSENFEFKELEILEPADDPSYDPAEDLDVLEALWIEKLTPFGDKGYSKPPKAGA